MEIVLNNKQIQQIADKTAQIVLKHIKTEPSTEPVLVNVREAARILGVSVDHMRKMKDDYPYIRRGNNQQGHIYFVREALTVNPVVNTNSNIETNNK